MSSDDDRKELEDKVVDRVMQEEIALFLRENRQIIIKRAEKRLKGMQQTHGEENN